MVFNLPALAPKREPPVVEQVAAPVSDLFRESGPSEPARQASKRAARDDDRDDSRGRDRDRDDLPPRRAKSKRSGGSALPWVLGLGGAALVLFLLCAGGIGVIAVLGFSAKKANPQQVVAVNNPPIANLNPPFANPPGPGPGMKGNPAAGEQVQLKQGSGKRIQLVNGQVQITSQLTLQDPFDPEDKQFRCKLYHVDLQAGRTYQIDMTSPNPQLFDPYLRIEDSNEVVLAQDDDSGGNLNARIQFRPNFSGSFIVVATCFRPNQFGAFTLTIRDTTAGFK